MKIRDIVFWLHLAAGLTAGVIIFVMSLTGAFMVFEKELFSYVDREAFSANISENKDLMKLTDLAEIARTHAGNKRLTEINVQNQKDAPVIMHFGRDMQLCLNPFSGEILTRSLRMQEFMNLIESWHRTLGAGAIGKSITGLCNLLFLFLSISGIYLWWPRKWSRAYIKSVTCFNFSLKSRQRDWNWHVVAGFWTVNFVVIITVTGTIMSYAWANRLLYRVAGEEPPSPRQRQVEETHLSPDVYHASLNLDEVLRCATQKITDWVALKIRMPSGVGDDILVVVTEKDPNHPSPRSTVKINGQSYQLSSFQSYKDTSKGRLWRVWARYIHTGEAFGMMGKIIAFMACLGSLVLVWTGFSLAFRRFFVK